MKKLYMLFIVITQLMIKLWSQPKTSHLGHVMISKQSQIKRQQEVASKTNLLVRFMIWYSFLTLWNINFNENKVLFDISYWPLHTTHILTQTQPIEPMAWHNHLCRLQVRHVMGKCRRGIGTRYGQMPTFVLNRNMSSVWQHGSRDYWLSLGDALKCCWFCFKFNFFFYCLFKLGF